MIEELRKRWNTPEGEQVCQAVLRTLRSGQEISNVRGLRKYGERWDLRGITLPKDFVGRNMVITSADFSYAMLDGAQWERCRFQYVLFRKTNAESSRFWSCEFEDVDFIESRLINSLMSGALDYVHAGHYKRVRFVNTMLLGTVYTHGLFERCEFIDCKLNHVDFGGSRFVDTRFKGKLKEVFFHGSPPVNPMTRPLVKIPPNKMERVDFREAYMISVDFLDGINLNSCLFPEGDDYMIIRNRAQVFTEARRIIEMSWEGYDKKLGLMLIDQCYLTKRKNGQHIEFVDRNYLVDQNDGGAGIRFFDFIRELSGKNEVDQRQHQSTYQDETKIGFFSRLMNWLKS